jgi:hypothetical protein
MRRYFDYGNRLILVCWFKIPIKACWKISQYRYIAAYGTRKVLFYIFVIIPVIRYHFQLNIHMSTIRAWYNYKPDTYDESFIFHNILLP